MKKNVLFLMLFGIINLHAMENPKEDEGSLEKKIDTLCISDNQDHEKHDHLFRVQTSFLSALINLNLTAFDHNKLEFFDYQDETKKYRVPLQECSWLIKLIQKKSFSSDEFLNLSSCKSPSFTQFTKYAKETAIFDKTLYAEQEASEYKISVLQNAGEEEKFIISKERLLKFFRLCAKLKAADKTAMEYNLDNNLLLKVAIEQYGFSNTHEFLEYFDALFIASEALEKCDVPTLKNCMQQNHNFKKFMIDETLNAMIIKLKSPTSTPKSETHVKQKNEPIQPARCVLC